MARSDKKYADPTAVLKSIVDNFGNPIEIGDQKDIGEFNATLLSRIQEGLHGNEILKKNKHQYKDGHSSSSSNNNKVNNGNDQDKHNNHNQDVEMINTSSIENAEAKDNDV